MLSLDEIQNRIAGLSPSAPRFPVVYENFSFDHGDWVDFHVNR
jgi:hypothetical protein